MSVPHSKKPWISKAVDEVIENKASPKVKEPVILHKAKELLGFTIHICSKEKIIPKRHRWCMANKIVELTISTTLLINEANETSIKSIESAKRRMIYQEKALLNIKSLSVLIDTAYMAFESNSGTFELWNDKLEELKKIMTGWIRITNSKIKEIESR